jgi:HlyD family secretion protein
MTTRVRRWPDGLRFIALVGVLLAAACSAPPPPEKPAAPKPVEGAVGALGRIEAGEGVVRIASRSLTGQISIVSRLNVKMNQSVKAGEILAVLDSNTQLEAAARQAAAEIEVARKRLAQAQAGAKPSEVAAQQMEIGRLESELDNAQKEYQRYSALGTNVSAVDLDRIKTRVDTTTRGLGAARARLTALTEIRPVDVDVAQAELDAAISNAARAQAEDTASMIRSPIDGRVIAIHAWPGEEVGSEGLLELAPVEPMYAIAEVAESDIARVQKGQRATISGTGLKSPLQGTVDRIAAKVLQNQVMPVSPANFSDARVVEVWIKVDDAKAVQDLIHLRVDVVIQT